MLHEVIYFQYKQLLKKYPLVNSNYPLSAIFIVNTGVAILCIPTRAKTLTLKSSVNASPVFGSPQAFESYVPLILHVVGSILSPTGSPVAE